MKTDKRIVSRHRARIAAMQVVFVTLSGGDGDRREADDSAPRDNASRALKRLLEAPFVENAAMQDDYVEQMATVFDSRRDEIEGMLADVLPMSLFQLSVTERAILSLAVTELLSQPLTASNIVIDEAVILAKEYGAEGGHKIVNGALDAIVRFMKR